jgi:hypothetical protein
VNVTQVIERPTNIQLIGAIELSIYSIVHNTHNATLLIGDSVANVIS